jgi:hypothetical protein
LNAHQRRVALRAWKRLVLAEDRFPGGLGRIDITRRELDGLGEYNVTTPTGARPGDRWRSNVTWRERWRARHGYAPRPPRFAPPVWIVATVLDEPHGHGGFVIRYALAAVVDAVLR